MFEMFEGKTPTDFQNQAWGFLVRLGLGDEYVIKPLLWAYYDVIKGKIEPAKFRAIYRGRYTRDPLFASAELVTFGKYEQKQEPENSELRIHTNGAGKLTIGLWFDNRSYYAGLAQVSPLYCLTCMQVGMKEPDQARWGQYCLYHALAVADKQRQKQLYFAKLDRQNKAGLEKEK